ncbi:hypothetical protein RB653_009202 [Dictyostelium firmibasis]|uniref:Uncharacterized protein n=1 Tax=Dictyostelium firmibasis TaxID=79012 RepID=A0AAN7U1D4_9MYCE
MNIFGGGNKKTPEQELKDSKRELSKGQREMDRELNRLKIVEQEYIGKIKQLAKAGRNDEAKRMATDLVKLRGQMERMRATKTTLSAVSTKTTTIKANQTMANAMASATKAMSTMNKQSDLVQLQKTMTEYEKQTQRSEMTEEMMQDMFEDDEMDEEADDILSKVVDEVCLDNYQKMPTVSQKDLPYSSKTSTFKTEDEELNKLLQSL